METQKLVNKKRMPRVSMKPLALGEPLLMYACTHGSC